jgi:H+/Cl- antiporter ClcA
MKIISTNAPLHLLLFAAVRIFLTATSVLLPIPCGLFSPVFLIGGALGRLVGELLSQVMPGIVRGGMKTTKTKQKQQQQKQHQKQQQKQQSQT